MTASALIGLFFEGARVLAVLPSVERSRLTLGPGPAVSYARRLSLRRRERDAGERELLRRVIGAVDRFVPGGGNCYRRSLLELALDRGAGREKFLAGFVAGGGARSGHAWLSSHGAPSESYDAVMTL